MSCGVLMSVCLCVWEHVRSPLYMQRQILWVSTVLVNVTCVGPVTDWHTISKPGENRMCWQEASEAPTPVLWKVPWAVLEVCCECESLSSEVETGSGACVNNDIKRVLGRRCLPGSLIIVIWENLSLFVEIFMEVLKFKH